MFKSNRPKIYQFFSTSIFFILIWSIPFISFATGVESGSPVPSNDFSNNFQTADGGVVVGNGNNLWLDGTSSAGFWSFTDIPNYTDEFYVQYVYDDDIVLVDGYRYIVSFDTYGGIQFDGQTTWDSAVPRFYMLNNDGSSFSSFISASDTVYDESSGRIRYIFEFTMSAKTMFGSTAPVDSSGCVSIGGWGLRWVSRSGNYPDNITRIQIRFSSRSCLAYSPEDWSALTIVDGFHHVDAETYDKMQDAMNQIHETESNILGSIEEILPEATPSVDLTIDDDFEDYVPTMAMFSSWLQYTYESIPVIHWVFDIGVGLSIWYFLMKLI